MTRPKKKTKIPHEFRTVRFEYWEIESPAFKALSADATRVYLHMRHRYNGSNNGRIPYSHRDAAKDLHAGGGWRRGSNALAELQHFGFTKCRQRGEPGAPTADALRPASEWQVTVYEYRGHPPSKDFLRWAGAPFDPPYKGTLGAETRAQRKQLPIGNRTTPRRQQDDASGRDSDSYPPKGANPSATRRRLGPRSVGNRTTHIDIPGRGPHCVRRRALRKMRPPSRRA